MSTKADTDFDAGAQHSWRQKTSCCQSGGQRMHEIAAIIGHRLLSMMQLYMPSADQERLAGAAIVRLQTRTNAQKK